MGATRCAGVRSTGELQDLDTSAATSLLESAVLLPHGGNCIIRSPTRRSTLVSSRLRRGELHHLSRDTPATRRKEAPNGAKPPIYRSVGGCWRVRWRQTLVAAGPDEASKLHNEAQAHTASSQKRRRHGNRVIRTTRVGRGSVPGVGGEVSAGEASAALACSRRRWGLAVTCACVVRHCACVLASPMGVGSIGRGPSDRGSPRTRQGQWCWLYWEGST